MSSGGLYQIPTLRTDDHIAALTLPAKYLPAREYGRPERCEVIPVLGPAIAAARAELAQNLDTGTVHVLPPGHDLEVLTLNDLATAPPATRPGAVRTRVFRIPQNPDDPELRPTWAWRCPNCDMSGNGCLHQVIHTPGTWRAAFCAGFHHAHRRHPRPPAHPGATEHTTMHGRRRCDWRRPTELQQRLASWVLCGRTGMPSGDIARQFAREVLALAGQRTPG